MPKISKRSTLRDWERLLQAVQDNQSDLAGVEPFRAALAKAHAQATVFRDVRDSLVTAASDATKRLNEAITTGRDAAFCLRSFIKSVHGPRSAKLLKYGIRSLRQRRAGSNPPNGPVNS